jgi:hypothetical protein
VHRYERVQAEGFGDGYLITILENDPEKLILVLESYVLLPKVSAFRADPVVMQSNPGLQLSEADVERFHDRTIDHYWSMFVEYLGPAAAGYHQRKIRREKLGAMGMVAIALDEFCLPCLRRISSETHSSRLRHDIAAALASVEPS